MGEDYSRELAAAKEIARRAGAVMLRYFEVEKGTLLKEDNTPVTLADKEINRLVIEELETQFDDGIIGEEESTAEYGAGRRWICDPIDGTKGFILGTPMSMFSLGFVVDGVATLGVAYDPFLDKLYCAARGIGSFCNGTPLSVSHKSIAEAYVGLSGNAKKIDRYADCITRLAESGAEIVSFSGSVYKMCMVARGSLVGYMEAGINPHDTAAGEVIVEEAGGKVTDFKGQPLDYSKRFKGAVFSNTIVHQELLDSLAGIEFSARDL